MRIEHSFCVKSSQGFLKKNKDLLPFIFGKFLEGKSLFRVVLEKEGKVKDQVLFDLGVNYLLDNKV